MKIIKSLSFGVLVFLISCTSAVQFKADKITPSASPSKNTETVNNDMVPVTVTPSPVPTATVTAIPTLAPTPSIMPTPLISQTPTPEPVSDISSTAFSITKGKSNTSYTGPVTITFNTGLIKLVHRLNFLEKEEYRWDLEPRYYILKASYDELNEDEREQYKDYKIFDPENPPEDFKLDDGEIIKSAGGGAGIFSFKKKTNWERSGEYIIAPGYLIIVPKGDKPDELKIIRERHDAVLAHEIGGIKVLNLDLYDISEINLSSLHEKLKKLNEKGLIYLRNTMTGEERPVSYIEFSSIRTAKTFEIFLDMFTESEDVIKTLSWNFAGFNY